MKIITVLLCAFTLFGCGGGWDTAKNRQAVTEAFSDSEVTNLPGTSYKFIIRKGNGEIWYAEMMNSTNLEPSAKVLLFKAK